MVTPRAQGHRRHMQWAERLLEGGGNEQWGDKWRESFKDGAGGKTVRSVLLLATDATWCPYLRAACTGGVVDCGRQRASVPALVGRGPLW